jgi:hypothetical protein
LRENECALHSSKSSSSFKYSSTIWFLVHALRSHDHPVHLHLSVCQRMFGSAMRLSHKLRTVISLNCCLLISVCAAASSTHRRASNHYSDDRKLAQVQERIVGGAVAAKDKYPNHVQWKLGCGGSLFHVDLGKQHPCFLFCPYLYSTGNLQPLLSYQDTQRFLLCLK